MPLDQLGGLVVLEGLDTLETTVVERSRLVGVLAQDPASSVCLPRVDEEVALVLENQGVDQGAVSGRPRRGSPDGNERWGYNFIRL